MEKIIVLDTETTNTLVDESGRLDMTDVLVYDVGWAVVDRNGKVYETASYVNRDIFCKEKELMGQAYFADKIPQYWEEIKSGKRKIADFYEIRAALIDTLDRYDTTIICAHNARFDRNALNRTQAYLSKSRFRWFFPYGKIEWWDSMAMARSIVAKMPSYVKFCEQNEYVTAKGKPKLTAEVLYRFITHNNEFVESHTGLEDVMIEKEIMAYCFRQHKPMEKELFPTYQEEKEPITEFILNFYRSLKNTPTLAAVRA